MKQEVGPGGRFPAAGPADGVTAQVPEQGAGVAAIGGRSSGAPVPAVGVLAVQGDFAAHLDGLARLGVAGREVRTPGDLAGLDGVILPGGESGAHRRILQENGLFEALRRFHDEGGALYGTCAGLILLARSVTNPVQESLGLIDVDVVRNGYGRQIDSFEAVGRPEPGGPFEGRTLPMVFIRAPRIGRLGPGVEVLLRHDEEPVAVREGRVLASTFHPEMTDDETFHRYFLTEVIPQRDFGRNSLREMRRSSSPA